MKRYFDHMHSKHPHERRQHAMRMAGVLTAIVFAGWVTTLGIKTTLQSSEVANTDATNQTAAAAGYNITTGNQLIVSTSTDY